MDHRPSPRHHPSGRPIRRTKPIERTVWRIPDHGLVTPRLREQQRDLSMVGFHRSYVEQPEDEQA